MDQKKYQGWVGENMGENAYLYSMSNKYNIDDLVVVAYVIIIVLVILLIKL